MRVQHSVVSPVSSSASGLFGGWGVGSLADLPVVERRVRGWDTVPCPGVEGDNVTQVRTPHRTVHLGKVHLTESKTFTVKGFQL